MKMKSNLPGMMPKPDNQGKANTCTRHAVGKALTGGLHVGTFGTKLDVNQDSVTNALVNKGMDVGGCWPTIFNMMTILVLDRSSSEYYDIDIKVAKCSFTHLQQNWNNSKFVVVYKTNERTNDRHCIYVNKVENGKLCCINSTGKKNQFPQLKPDDVESIYKIDAKVNKTSIQPTSPKMKTKAELEVENARLMKEIEDKSMAEQRLTKENEDNSSKIAKLEKENEALKNVSKKDTFQKAKKEVKSYWNRLTSVVGNGIKKQTEKVCTFVENRK